MHNRLQRVPTKRIKTRNSETTKPNQFLDTADQICLTPELLHWKQCHFINVKPEREKGNRTHPDSPYFHSVPGSHWPKLPNIWVPSQAICSLGKLMAQCPLRAVYCLPLAVTQSKEEGKTLCIYRSTDDPFQVTAEAFTPQNKPGHLLPRQSSSSIVNTADLCGGFDSEGQWAEPAGQAQRGRSALHGFHKQCWGKYD